MTRKKTLIFWVGLIITVLCLLFLFQICGLMLIIYHPSSRWEFFKGIIPLVFGFYFFVLVGLWMMLSENRKSLSKGDASP